MSIATRSGPADVHHVQDPQAPDAQARPEWPPTPAGQEPSPHRDGDSPAPQPAAADDIARVQPKASAPADRPVRSRPQPTAEVAAVFDAIAPVYDRVNSVLSLRVDGRWRRRACQEARVGTGDGVVDVACGTGKLAQLLADAVGPFGRVEAVDLSPKMVQRAEREHHALVQLSFRVADALALPFEDGQFDAATIAFGLRNLPDVAGGFRELRRVVRPGGRVVCLELALPRSRPLASLFHTTFRHAAPVAARLAGASRDGRRYLPASLDGFPSPEELAVAMRDAGLGGVRFWRLSGGIVTLHRATVPG